MKKIKNQSCLWEMFSVTGLTRIERKANRNWHSFFVLLIIFFALFSVPWAQAIAASVTLEFETQGLSLKSGTVVKVIPKKIKETTRADISIAYNADITPHAVLMLRRPGIEIVTLKDVAFDQVKADSIVKLNFTTKFIDQSLKQSNTVVLRMANGSVYKIGDVVESKTSITFSYEQLQKGRE